MNRIQTILVSITLIFLYTSSIPADKSIITLEIIGLRNSKGTVRIGVYNKEKDFLKDAGVVKRLQGKIVNNKCIIKTEPFAFGSYSFALLHDENDNEKMDYNWIKMPEEGFGFSQNPKVSLSAPSFEETKVEINAPTAWLIIKVKYM